jgi:hypothetical protein
MPEAPPGAFVNIGVREMNWGKFDALTSFTKTSIKNQQHMERLHPFLDMFLTVWPSDWRKQLQFWH